MKFFRNPQDGSRGRCRLRRLTVVSRASSHATTPLRAAPVNLRVMREETTADLVVADIRNF
jgi:hypothetical protein